MTSQNAHVVANAQETTLAHGYRLFAAALIGLGVLGLVSGDFASVWQQIPIEHLPFRALLAYAIAALELATGIGLLFRRSAPIASCVLVIFLLLWAVLLKLPAVVTAPHIEANWLGLAEVTVMVAGAWIVLTAFATDRLQQSLPGSLVGAAGLRNARILFALSLLPIGLSHFFYPNETAAFVPPWLPVRAAWGYLTGAGDILAGIAILLGWWPRLAATTVAAMLTIVTVLVWTPGLTPAANGLQFQTTGFLISATIAAAAWIVADSYRSLPWFTRSTRALRQGRAQASPSAP
jgi:uncharacterized membrane protein